MRLWHVDLLPKLPRQQLLGQHREACALRGAGWGKPHATVNYVFDHPYSWLYGYHLEVMQEMVRRGYNVDPLWSAQDYRGKMLGYDSSTFTSGTYRRYPEHDDAYLAECLDNLRGKGVEITTHGINI